MSTYEEITDPAAVLHRILMKTAWVQGTIVSGEAFKLRPADGMELSLVNCGKSETEALAEWHDASPRSKANATVKLRCSDVTSIGRCVYLSPEPKIPSHCHIDFVGCTDDECELAAERLAQMCAA